MNRLQKNTEQYFSSKEKKPFDRVRTAESFKNLQEVKKSREANSGSPISHRPVRKDVASHSRQEESFSHSPARPRVDQKTLHKTNELFIAKLVFDALDHVASIWQQSIMFLGKRRNHFKTRHHGICWHE